MSRLSLTSPTRNSLNQDPRPSSIEVSFVVHTIKGSHFSNQAAVAAVNGHSFILFPRDTKRQLRVYNSGFIIYVPTDEIIRFAVGVVTPDDKKSGFLHNFVRYIFNPPQKPIVENLTLETLGGAYTITASIFVAPSLKCSTPSPSKKPQTLRKRSKTQIARPRNKSVPPRPRPATSATIKQSPNSNAQNEKKKQQQSQPTPFVTAPTGNVEE